MFSADFRRAVAAEAAGDYAEAARAYALAGERVKVAEMHLLRSERAPSPAAKLHELRAAVRWADAGDEEGRGARRRIARALFGWARAATLLGDPEKQVVREAAQLFGDVGDFSGAGECHEFVGDELQAAEFYQRAGDVDRLESVLAREEQRRKRESRVREAFEEYRLGLTAGERDRALEAIRQCAEAPLPAAATVSPDKMAELTRDRTSYQRLREELEAKLIADGTISLRAGAAGQARQRRYVGAFPLVMGRDTTCQLVMRDAGISRQHAEIAVAADGRFELRDRDSKNGTTLGGLRIAGALPLGESGELGLGELCTLGYRVVGGDTLELEVTRGLDRGLRVTAGYGPLAVEDVGELVFIDGRPRLSAIGGRLLYLNGVHAAGAIQLIRGDVIELGEQRLEVA
jgi:hypothetical protein